MYVFCQQKSLILLSTVLLLLLSTYLDLVDTKLINNSIETPAFPNIRYKTTRIRNPICTFLVCFPWANRFCTQSVVFINLFSWWSQVCRLFLFTNKFTKIYICKWWSIDDWPPSRSYVWSMWNIVPEILHGNLWSPVNGILHYIVQHRQV